MPPMDDKVYPNTHRINRVPPSVPYISPEVRGYRITSEQREKAIALRKKAEDRQHKELLRVAKSNYEAARASIHALSDPFHALRVYWQTIHGTLDNGENQI